MPHEMTKKRPRGYKNTEKFPELQSEGWPKLPLARVAENTLHYFSTGYTIAVLPLNIVYF